MAATPCVLLAGKHGIYPYFISGMLRFLVCQQKTHFEEVWLIEGHSQSMDVAGEERKEGSSASQSSCMLTRTEHKDSTQGEEDAKSRARELQSPRSILCQLADLYLFCQCCDCPWRACSTLYLTQDIWKCDICLLQ